jgi:hypothetical protein
VGSASNIYVVGDYVGCLRDLEIAQLAFDATKRELDAHNLKVKIAQIELEKGFDRFYFYNCT